MALYTSTHQFVFVAWCLVKHRDNFTFTIAFYHLCSYMFASNIHTTLFLCISDAI